MSRHCIALLHNWGGGVKRCLKQLSALKLRPDTPLSDLKQREDKKLAHEYPHENGKYWIRLISQLDSSCLKKP